MLNLYYNEYGRDYYIMSPGKTLWGKILPPLEFPKLPSLTHTLTCKPTLRSEAERSAHELAAESSISSQDLEESAVPNTCPKTMDRQNAVPLASSLHCQYR